MHATLYNKGHAPARTIYRIAGNFRGVQNFAFFEGRAVM